MNGVFWISHGSEPPDGVKYGDIDWPYAGDWCADGAVAELADGLTRSSLNSSPIVLFGDSGCGKTLLARNLFRLIEPHIGNTGSIQINGLDFKRTYHQAMDTQTHADWRRNHVKKGLVLLDQLDQLIGDVSCQNALESLLDSWLARSTIVIVATITEPSQLIGITPRLKSRLAAGACVQLSNPGLAAKKWLIHRWMKERTLPDVGPHAEFLTQWWNSQPVSVPWVHGVINQLALRYSSPLADPAVLHDWLADELCGNSPPPPNTDQIARAVARRFGLPLREIRGASRRRATVRARATTMWLVRKLTKLSYSRIGVYFSKRDHSTVLHACTTIEKQRSVDGALCQCIDEVERELIGNPATLSFRGNNVCVVS